MDGHPLDDIALFRSTLTFHIRLIPFCQFSSSSFLWGQNRITETNCRTGTAESKTRFAYNLSSYLLLSPPRQRLYYVCCLSFHRSLFRITATTKVISRFHCNLVLWLGLPIGRTD